MSTVRVTRPPAEAPARQAALQLSIVLGSVLLGVAIFVCCFAIGRAERPRLAASEQLPPGVPAVYAGTSIPTALGSAPSIDIRDIIVVKAPLPVTNPTTRAQTPLTSTVTADRSNALTPVISSARPATQTPTPITPKTPATPLASTPVSTGEQSTGTKPSPPSAKRAPAPSSEAGSTSFDSSD